ncbi:MAG: hypothetical protein MOGMAGMI_01123 [Candidatus Omnitrophica bacterium]|nr:hypothetical protein [Candidatus Omnitrophota bacterium]
MSRERIPNPSDRREHPRARRAVTALVSAADAETPSWDMVVAHDISLSGMRFACDRLYPEGTLLNFRFPIAGETDPEERLGVVVRLSPATDYPLHRIAVRFEGLPAATPGSPRSRLWGSLDRSGSERTDRV